MTDPTQAEVPAGMTPWQSNWEQLEDAAGKDTGDEGEDGFNVGRRDGFSEAVQLIDQLTGGDGEYRYCTVPDEGHCPDPDAMIGRIVARLYATATPSTSVQGAGEADHPLARMVALDEEMEANHAGWMTGDATPPAPASVAESPSSTTSDVKAETAARVTQASVADEARARLQDVADRKIGFSSRRDPNHRVMVRRDDLRQLLAFAARPAGEGEVEQHMKTVIVQLDSLTSWLLHRFGPDTPEGREALARRKPITRAALATEGTRS